MENLKILWSQKQNFPRLEICYYLYNSVQIEQQRRSMPSNSK